MRTLRKVFCILILAGLVTSAAAMAAPINRSDDARSIRSWALSLLDSITAVLVPEDLGGSPHPPSGLSPASGQSEAEPSNEVGGGTDSQVPPASFDDGEDPQNGEVGGGVDPNG